MIPWKFADAPINEIDDLLAYTKGKKPYGFVYKITHTPTGRMYIGRKNLYWTRRKKIAGRIRRKKVVTESDWKKYYGSSDELKALLKKEGSNNFIREILFICFTKRQLSYTETKTLFSLGVLESDAYFNRSIQGKWFKGSLD